MSRINQIQNGIKELNGGAFQKLCDTYLRRKFNLDRIISYGSQEGTDKTTRGIPDAHVKNSDGTYTMIMSGTDKNTKKKIEKDILDCLNETKTGISKSKIRKIFCCHISTNLSPGNREYLENLAPNIEVELVGIDMISQDLSTPKFQDLAKDYLGIKFDSGQIFSTEKFIEAYDSNKTLSPLDNEFKFRKDELKKISSALQENSAVLITGASGVGKTRIALETCLEYEELGYQVLCIKNNGLQLYDDFTMAISENMKYLIFFDDLNQTTDFQSISDFILLKNGSEAKEIKIVATVRDYAKDRVLNLFGKFGNIREISIPTFMDEEITMLLDESLGITNPIFREKIVEIAKGNARLAVLSGNLAMEDVQNIQNAEGIFKQYYGNIINEVKLSQDEIKALFLISLLYVIKVDNDDFAKILLDEFKLSWGRFREICLKLSQEELIDFYLDEAVKINDQSFGNFMLELGLIDQKLISVEHMLELGFIARKGRIIYAIWTILELFHSEKTEDYLISQINQRWEDAEPEQQDMYLEHFYWTDLEKTLSIIKTRINKMEPLSEEKMTDESFEEKSRNENISSLEVKILSSFNMRCSVYFEDAVELLIRLFSKRPDLFMDVFFAISKNMGFNRRSYDNDYTLENKLVCLLWKYYKKVNTNYDFLMLKIIDNFLNTSFRSIEPGNKPGSMVVTHVSLVLTEGSRKFRKNLWKMLSEVYFDKMNIYGVEKILSKYHWKEFNGHTLPIIEFDSKCIQKFFVDKWNKPTFNQSLILSKLAGYAKNLNVTLDESFLRYKDNDDFKYYEIIKPKRYDNVSDWDKKREKEIEIATKFFSLNDYIRLVKVAKKVEKSLIENTYGCGQNFSIVLKYVPDNKFKALMQRYFNFNAPFGQSCVNMGYYLLIKYGFEETLALIRDGDFQFMNYWISHIFDTIPVEIVERAQMKILISFIDSQVQEKNPSIPRLKSILKYKQFNQRIAQEVSRKVVKIVEKDENSVRNFLSDYYQSPRELVEIFQEDLSSLEDLYLLLSETYFDYNGKLLAEIARKDAEFLGKFSEKLFGGEPYKTYEQPAFYEIWKLDNYSELINIAFEKIPKKGIYVGSDTYKTIFMIEKVNDSSDFEVANRIKSWILHYIRKNNASTDLMYHFFFHVVSLFSEMDRLEFIREFLKNNMGIDDFKNLDLLSTFYIAFGSRVPIIDTEISFLKRLKESSFLRGVDFIDHREYLEKRIVSCRKDKKSAQLREYSEDLIEMM